MNIKSIKDYLKILLDDIFDQYDDGLGLSLEEIKQVMPPIIYSCDTGKYLSKYKDYYNVKYDKKNKVWKRKESITPVEEEKDTSKEQESGKIIIDVNELIKNSIYSKITQESIERCIENNISNKLKSIVKDEFKNEVLPSVMNNLGDVLIETKEELKSYIDQILDRDLLKDLIVQVLIEAFDKEN